MDNRGAVLHCQVLAKSLTANRQAGNAATHYQTQNNRVKERIKAQKLCSDADARSATDNAADIADDIVADIRYPRGIS